jgi:hypothetical protein
LRSHPSARTLLASAILAACIARCGTVDLGPTPADVGACRPSQAFFLNEIWPNVLAKDYGGRRCYDSSCHDGVSGHQPVLKPPTSLPMLPLPADWAAVYKSTTEKVLCTDVSSSKLLTRPDGRQPHGGNKLFEPDGPEATLVKMWVTAK